MRQVYHEYLPAGTVLEYTPEGATTGNALKVRVRGPIGTHSTASPGQRARLCPQIEKEVSAYDSDVAAAVDYALASPHCNGSVGVYGLCLGGGLAIRASLHPAVSATVRYRV